MKRLIVVVALLSLLFASPVYAQISYGYVAVVQYTVAGSTTPIAKAYPFSTLDAALAWLNDYSETGYWASTPDSSFTPVTARKLSGVFNLRSDTYVAIDEYSEPVTRGKFKRR